MILSWNKKNSHAMFSANIHSCNSLADNFLNLVYMLSATTIIGNAAFFINLKAPIYNLPEHFFRLGLGLGLGFPLSSMLIPPLNVDFPSFMLISPRSTC